MTNSEAKATNIKCKECHNEATNGDYCSDHYNKNLASFYGWKNEESEED